ncbi:HlyD family efflux transporter periplasmic adaptor subunit [Mesorhizobium sp. CAU 1741]|uniref:HlyD family secretion protein n=1 Tax=Mesorhizobium sp. CAU 1741 TaxID=3140366 RepID=UPI00325B3BD6
MSFLCSLPLAASFFMACGQPAPLAVGYVEGDYVLLAPIETAQLRSLDVRRGDRVETSQTIADLESEDARLAVAEAKAALDQAQAQLADLKLGKRPEEIAVLEAALSSARAEAAEAGRVLERTRDLNGRGIATRAELDKAETAFELAKAGIEQAEANLSVAGLPAREETIRAAQGQVERAGAALAQARWRLEKRTIVAPASGRIADVIRGAGDIAGPSAPVVSLLPDGAVRLKLYVPEPAFSSVQIGALLDIRCDGCPAGLRARVSYASPEPEFTPPVIYSLETRQKLVHLVEARPEGDAETLKPGQIVDVRLVP